MKKRAILLLHIFTWLFAAALNINSFTRLKSSEMLIAYCISMLFLVITFYLFYFVYVPAFLQKRRMFHFLVVSAFTIGVIPFFGYSFLLLNKALHSKSSGEFYQGYTLAVHFSGMLTLTIAAIFGSFFKVIISWFHEMDQKEKAEKQRIFSELSLLKNKVNPHFLFNTLNNIDVLIFQDPEKASRALLKLSEIMRYMSYETSSEYIDLDREIKYIENLVELYKLRITDPELISVDFPKIQGSIRIAPALFIPFIENAFKYATFKGEHAGFFIHLSAKGSVVFFRTVNYYDKFFAADGKNGGGTGIDNVKRRLDIMYPQKYDLCIMDSGNKYEVELKIDTNGN